MSTDEMSSVQKLGLPVHFLFTITAVHGSLKLSREQGEREFANSLNKSLRTSVIYFMFSKTDNYWRCNAVKLHPSDDIIIQLSKTIFFLIIDTITRIGKSKRNSIIKRRGSGYANTSQVTYGT